MCASNYDCPAEGVRIHICSLAHKHNSVLVASAYIVCSSLNDLRVVTSAVILCTDANIQTCQHACNVNMLISRLGVCILAVHCHQNAGRQPVKHLQ